MEQTPHWFEKGINEEIYKQVNRPMPTRKMIADKNELLFDNSEVWTKIFCVEIKRFKLKQSIF